MPNHQKVLIHLALFLFLLFGISWLYDYGEIMHWSPRSTHQWRQTDGASIALNYFNDGMALWQPRFHYQFQDKGYTAPVGETTFPYYAVAGLYHLSGPKPATFRLFYFFFFALGLYALSRICLEAYDHLGYALWVSTALFASGLLAFYALNFVPNTPALGLAWVAWYGIWRAFSQRSLGWFVAAMLAFVGAVLFKIPGLLSFMLLPGIWVLSLFIRSKPSSLLVQKRWPVLALMGLPLMVAFLWMQWAQSYNEAHASNYFLSSLKPLWETADTDRAYIFTRTMNEWGQITYHRSMWWLLSLLALGILIRPRQVGWKLYLSFLGLLFGCLVFYILWYGQFLHHDYYLIEMMVFPALILLLFPLAFPKISKSPYFLMVAFAIVGWNIYHSKQALESRYAPESVFMSYLHPSFYQTDALQAHLNTIGIRKQDRLISVPDNSPNISLYHLNRPGWSELYFNRPIRPAEIETFRSRGATYFVIADTTYLSRPDLQPYLQKPLPPFQGIYFFDLKDQ